MKRQLVNLLLPALLISQPASAGIQRDAAQVGERKIYWNNGVPLSSLLSSDDRLVIVEKATSHEPPFHVGPPLTVAEELHRLDATSHAIVVLRVTDLKAELTSAGDWIRTRVRGDTVERVKTPTSPSLEVTGLVDFEVDGGEMRFGNTIVRAGTYPVFRTGSTYLVTLVADRDGVWRLSQHFLVDRTGKISVPEFFNSRGEKPSDQILGLRLAEVTKRLKRP